jgi:electron transfer flavoprotein alpha subunit
MSVKNVWAVADKAGAASEVVSAARQLGEHVVAVVADAEWAVDAIAHGADEVLTLDGSAAMVESYAEAIADQAAAAGAGLLLFGHTAGGLLLAGRAASKLGTSAVTGAAEISQDGDSIQVSHMVYGGAAVRVEKVLTGVAVVSLAAGAYPVLPPDAGREGTIAEFSGAPDDKGIVLREVRVLATESVNLAAAPRVVGVGRGFAEKADLSLAEALCAAIGAELACSRPIAEGVNWLPKDRYIGVSGAQIKPDVYVAVGISGQIQHMVGVNRAKTIVAVNKDKNAPIFKQTDIGIVGDLYTILPKVTARIEAA